MSRTPTTRMGLLEVRSRLGLATRGARLLRGKREVLANEFFRLAREVVAGRERLDAALADAGQSLAVARAREGAGPVESLAVAGAREVPVTVTHRRVWGVAVPRVEAPRLVRGPAQRGVSTAGLSLSVLDAARRHEEALELLLAIASRELHLRRVGAEIRDTSRRINALEQLLAPALERESARVESVLDERAREDAIRLKRFRRRHPR
ncbi:MAG TPA: V-type ATP synthase subunit D [Anaeromyxobacteraceae bacterium]|nr:V-type ATP synthase subunit D [Anaeromyxobacteraceae bacterium]